MLSTSFSAIVRHKSAIQSWELSLARIYDFAMLSANFITGIL